MTGRAAWVGGFSVVLVGLSAKSLLAADAIDNVVTLVDGANATNGKSIASFGYNPLTNTFYVTAYGTSNTQNSVVRAITGVGTGATPGTLSSTAMISEAQQRYFYADGNPTWSISGTVAASSFLINPKDIVTSTGTIAAYSQAYIIDGVTVTPASGATVTAAQTSDRVSRYSLQQVVSVDGDNSDALVQLKSVANLSDFQAATGSTASMNWIRQSAWSSDGQSLYQADTSTGYGGIWKINAATGAVTRIVTANSGTTINTELAVKAVSDTVDRIFFKGNTAGGNIGGINSVDYTKDATAASAQSIYIDATKITDFLELSGGNVADIRSITAGPDGSLYFQDNTTGGTYRVDQNGNLIKVTTRAERNAALGITSSNTALRLQTRQITTAGGFTATQLMFTENVSNSVSGATVFKPGDFDRDNSVTTADKTAFLAALGTRGQSSGVSRYDLNGNSVVDWKDVKVLQSFLGFANGDTNLDGAVNFTDLDVVRDNYYDTTGLTNRTWANGDFSSLMADADTYAASAADANLVTYVDLLTLANHFSIAGVTAADLESRYSGAFLTAALQAFNVPEPTMAMLLLPAAFLARRRSNRI
ncbi:MAG: hypothetical protein QM754_16180 [Tepidisphaeraceae bacterium]